MLGTRARKNKTLADGSLELTSEVAGTKEIKDLDHEFGSLANVLEPASLVREIKEDLSKVLNFTRIDEITNCDLQIEEI